MYILPIPENPALRVLAAFTWGVVHRLLIVVLGLLEPVVRYICIPAMLLGILAAVVFEISAVGPTFSFLGAIAVSLGFGFVWMVHLTLLMLLLR